MVTLIGMGAGLSGSLTAEGLAALQQADLILGARRLLENLPDGCTEHRKALYKPEEILTCLAEHPDGGVPPGRIGMLDSTVLDVKRCADFYQVFLCIF